MSLEVTARNLLEKFGEQVTFTRETKGSYDVNTAEYVSSTSSNYSGFGVPTRYHKSEIDGELIRFSDTRFIVEKTSLRPEVTDKVALDNNILRVMNVQQIRLSGNDIIYILQLRA